MTIRRVKFRPSSHSEAYTGDEIYQEFEVEFALPEGSTSEAIALIAGAEASAIIAFLSKRCNRHQIKQDGNRHEHIYHYRGIYVLHKDETKKGARWFLVINGKRLLLSKLFKLRMIYQG
jgi:hypothetical protein